MRFRFVPIGLLLFGCGARSGLDTAASSDDADASPSSCLDSPAAPMMLATVGDFSKYDQVTAMTVVNGFVYYAVANGSNVPVAIFRVPISGGAATAVIQGEGGCNASSPFAYGNLVTDGRYIFTPDEESVGCSGYQVHVTAYDTTNDTLSELPVPAGADPMPRAVSPQALDGGGVAWVIDSGTYTGPVVVARWTGGPQASVFASLPEMATGFLVAGDVGFASTLANGTATLDSVSLTTGAVTSIGQFSANLRLFAANHTAIFYTPDGSTLVRREVGSGAVTELNVPLPFRAIWVDDDYFYTDALGASPPTSFPAVLSRLPEKGGAAKEIFRDADRNGIQAITGDACNVYWVTGPNYDEARPPALYVRKR